MTTEQLLIESLLGQTESRAIFETRYTHLRAHADELERKNAELEDAIRSQSAAITGLSNELQKMRDDSRESEPRLCELYEASESLFRVSGGVGTGARKDAIAEARSALRKALTEAHDYVGLIPF